MVRSKLGHVELYLQAQATIGLECCESETLNRRDHTAKPESKP